MRAVAEGLGGGFSAGAEPVVLAGFEGDFCGCLGGDDGLFAHAAMLRGARGNASAEDASLLQTRRTRGRDAVIHAADGDDGREFGMRDAEHAGEFALEVEQRARLGGILIEKIERAPEQVVQFGRGVLGLGREFDQLDEVRRECDAAVVGAEPGACVAQVGLTERVQVAFCAACDGDVAVEKKIEHAGEAALRTQRSFHDGLQPPVVAREPRDDEARLAEPRFPQQDGFGGLHATVNAADSACREAEKAAGACSRAWRGRWR